MCSGTNDKVGHCASDRNCGLDGKTFHQIKTSFMDKLLYCAPLRLVPSVVPIPYCVS